MAKIIDVDDSEKISLCVLGILNDYPALDEAVVEFSKLNERGGIGMYAAAGSDLLEDRIDITGGRTQRCAYSFDIVYRAAPNTETQKMRIKEFLDGFGRWLEQQPISIDGVEYKLRKYPEILAGHKLIRNIYRTSAAHLQTSYDDGVEDWVISISMMYLNYYD